MKAILCAPITESSVDAAIRVSNTAKTDLIELRLDYLDEPAAGPEYIQKIRKPVIVTCMPEWEGGRFKDSEKERINILKEACKYAKYVSIELKTKKNLRDSLINEAKEKEVKVIVSHHDYNKTPSNKEIKRTISREKKAGADIAKISYMAREYSDALRVLKALTENRTGIPLIAISMGEKGRITRFMGPLLGSYLTFASVGKGRESAPGQMTVEELKKIFEIIG